MSASALTLGMYSQTTLKPAILLRPKPNTKPNKVRVFPANSAPIFQPSYSDPFVLQLADTLEDSLPPSTSSSSPLQTLRDNSSQSLLSTPWPSLKDEAFRFTDISFIKSSQIEPVSERTELGNGLLSGLEGTQLPSLVIVDGFVLGSSSKELTFPDGVYVGSLLGLPKDGNFGRILDLLGPDFVWGDLFWSVNGLGAPDVAVVYVPAGVKVEDPIHLRYVSVVGGEEGSKRLPLSNPRVLVVVEDGGEVGIVEEFSCGDGSGNKSYWANSVFEVVIGEGAKVRHSYLQGQSSNAAHTKWTSVRQESASTYELVEISAGGKLSRHNLHVQQLGPDTVTELSTLHLSVGAQTQDLHSKLVLDHPRAFSRQLHKSIVAHSQGQSVFDGNVQVNRYAQQTDAGQLTRSLLLEPRATVNIKPNLQIIADDVKCSHGAAISDLEEGQLFYLQTRGIDLATARKALLFSFGAEVIAKLPTSSIRKEVENRMKALLDA